MSREDAFLHVLQGAKNVFQRVHFLSDCPASDMLVDYAYRSLGGDENRSVREHVKHCDKCRLAVACLEGDRFMWNELLDSDPEKAVAAALADDGRRKVRAIMPSHPSFISKIKESMVSWITPLWQPLYAGEPVTAASVEQQDTRFEMDYGEYINLSCQWQDDRDEQPCIELAWQANLLQTSKIWARFMCPDTNEFLIDIFLGTELEGKRCIPGEQLNFQPSVDKWAIAIIIEED